MPSSATITSVVTTATPAPRSSNLTIHGTGFSGAQGNSYILFYPEEGGSYEEMAIVSWSATVIVATIPADAVITGENDPGAFVALVLEGETVGARSDLFSIGAATPAAKTEFQNQDIVIAIPGTVDVDLNPLPVPGTYQGPIGFIDEYDAPNYEAGWFTQTSSTANDDHTVASTDIAQLGDITITHLTALGIYPPAFGGGG